MAYTVNEIKQLICKSEEYRDKFFKQRAIRNINWYNGNYNGIYTDISTPAIEPSLNYYVNLAYSTTRTMVTSLFSKFPEFALYMRGDLARDISMQYGGNIGNSDLAKLTEIAVKRYIKEMQLRRTDRLIITDAILMGFGVSKMGYNLDLDDTKTQLLMEKYTTNLKEYIELASNIEESELVRRSEPYALRIHPLNILFPVEAQNFNRLSWQAEIIYKNKDEAESFYNVKGKLSASYIDSYIDSKHIRDSKPNTVKIYEFHSLDPKDPYIYVLAEGYDKFLDKKKHPLYDEEKNQIKNLYQYLWFNESYCSIYPMADIDLVAPQIFEANIQVQKRVEHIRKFVRSYLASGVFEEEEIQKFINGEDGVVIKAEMAQATINPIPMADLSLDFYNNINAIRNEIYETLGLTDYAIGGGTQARKATEAQFVEQSRMNRVQERVDIIDEFCFNQVDTFIEIMKEYQQVPRMFSLELNDQNISLVFAGELLKQADIEIQVVPGSTMSLDKNAEVRWMERLMQAAAAAPGVVNVSAIFKDWLTKLGYSNADKYIIQPQASLPVPGLDGSTPSLPGLVNQAGESTQTPMQLNLQPNYKEL